MSDLLQHSLREPIPALAYSLGRALSEAFTDQVVFQGDGCSFGIEHFAHAGLCQLTYKPGVHQQVATSYCGPDAEEEDSQESLYTAAANTWYQVHWEGHSLEVVQASWQQGYHSQKVCFIIASTREQAESFYTAVCRWTSEIRGEVLVFDGGSWSKSKELYRAIRAATFDNLILAGDLKKEIHEDLQHFLASRATYQRYKIPWKRGVLLIGPPGNGKTHPTQQTTLI